MSVGLRDAHAWPELYFEGVGWTRFEPTPTRGSAPPVHACRTPPARTACPRCRRPSRSASTAPSAAPSASESCTPQEEKLEACASESARGRGGRGRRGPLGLGSAVWSPGPCWFFGGARWCWRSRCCRCCGGCGPGPCGWAGTAAADADAAAHALAAWQELTDTAWDYGIAPDESQTPRKAAARIVRLGELEPSAADAVHRVAARGGAGPLRSASAGRGGPRPGRAPGRRRPAGARRPPDAAAGTAAAAFDHPGGLGLSARWARTTDELLSRVPTLRLTLATPLAEPEQLRLAHPSAPAGFARRGQTRVPGVSCGRACAGPAPHGRVAVTAMCSGSCHQGSADVIDDRSTSRGRRFSGAREG